MYTRIYDAVLDPAAGYTPSEQRAAMLHSPSQVRTLLDI
jgi:hypothetical protein